MYGSVSISSWLTAAMECPGSSNEDGDVWHVVAEYATNHRRHVNR
jgi:hypothetical protein